MIAILDTVTGEKYAICTGWIAGRNDKAPYCEHIINKSPVIKFIMSVAEDRVCSVSIFGSRSRKDIYVAARNIHAGEFVIVFGKYSSFRSNDIADSVTAEAVLFPNRSAMAQNGGAVNYDDLTDSIKYSSVFKGKLIPKKEHKPQKEYLF